MTELEMAGYQIERADDGASFILRRFTFGRMATVGVYETHAEAAEAAVARMDRGE